MNSESWWNRRTRQGIVMSMTDVTNILGQIEGGDP
jgi:hypothetical protein